LIVWSQMIYCFLIFFCIPSELQKDIRFAQRTINGNENSAEQKQFIATSKLIDAAINSINSLNSLIKKENYRNKIATFNNPTSSGLGFSLEKEIQQALKPLLDKAKNTNANKFSGVIASLINNPVRTQLTSNVFATTGIFSSLLGLVGNLTVHEKKITKQDLDSFVVTLNKYFIQYEKLNIANRTFDQNIGKLNLKLKELQFDIREYITDMITVLYKGKQRQELKEKGLEELLLTYLDKGVLEDSIQKFALAKYPGDGIKTAKEIVYGIEKLFGEYQQVYSDNFNEIETILLQGKALGNNIDIKQVDVSVKELRELYDESKNADVLNIRLNTLQERLRILVVTEQNK
jgi:hypothetical protein